MGCIILYVRPIGQVWYIFVLTSLEERVDQNQSTTTSSTSTITVMKEDKDKENDGSSRPALRSNEQEMTVTNNTINGCPKTKTTIDKILKLLAFILFTASMSNVKFQALTFEMTKQQEFFGYVWIVSSFVACLGTMKIKSLLLTSLIPPLISLYPWKNQKACTDFSIIVSICRFFMALTILLGIIAMDLAVVKYHLFLGSNPLY